MSQKANQQNTQQAQMPTWIELDKNLLLSKSHMQMAINMQRDWNERDIPTTETDKDDASERTIIIRYFSALASRLGLDSETITLPEEIITIRDLIPWLMTRRGEWERALAGNLNIKVNRQFSDRSRIICDDDAIALVRVAEENIL